MKGIMKEATLLVKIVSLAYLVLVLLSVYFALTNYQLILVGNKIDRESLALGDSLLASECLAETVPGNCAGTNCFGIKGLLSESKIMAEQTIYTNYNSQISCFNYPKPLYIEIYRSDALLYSLGDQNVKGTENVYNTTFPAVMNTTSGVIPVRFTLYLAP